MVVTTVANAGAPMVGTNLNLAALFAVVIVWSVSSAANSKSQ